MVNVRGVISGELNNIQLPETDMHAFIHTHPSDGRNYIVARFPQVGIESTLTLLFAQPIHWLFAGSASDSTMNGFMLTGGGVFTRQSDSTFLDEQGQVIGNLFIVQNFTGINKDDNELIVNTQIKGNLPRFQQNEQVVYPDFNQDFVYKSNVENPETRKIVESRGSINYLLVNRDDPNNFKRFRIEHEERIHFSVCASPEMEEARTKSGLTQLMTKRLLVSFPDNQVRFTSANYMRNLMTGERYGQIFNPNFCGLSI